LSKSQVKFTYAPGQNEEKFSIISKYCRAMDKSKLGEITNRKVKLLQLRQVSELEQWQVGEQHTANVE